MRIAVMGTGAVGGYFGAKLAAAGDDVVFIARQRHCPSCAGTDCASKAQPAICSVRNGLFTDSPADAGMVDLVLFCVKSYDTAEAAAALAPMIDQANGDSFASKWHR